MACAHCCNTYVGGPKAWQRGARGAPMQSASCPARKSQARYLTLPSLYIWYHYYHSKLAYSRLVHQPTQQTQQAI